MTLVARTRMNVKEEQAGSSVVERFLNQMD